MYVYIYIYICVCIHTGTHIHTYIHNYIDTLLVNFISRTTPIPSSVEVRFQDPLSKSVSHPQNNFISSFLCRNIVMGAASFFLKLLEHHTVWLEDLFEVSKRFDAPNHRRARMMYFYSWSDPANLRNREKRGMSVGYMTNSADFHCWTCVYCVYVFDVNSKCFM